MKFMQAKNKIVNKSKIHSVCNLLSLSYKNEDLVKRSGILSLCSALMDSIQSLYN
jgi:hypothetical protein